MKFARLACLLFVSACGSVNDNQKQPDAAVPIDACVPETDVAVCARLTSACESQTTMDNCGVSRTVDCGACMTGQGCVVGTCKTPVCSSFTYTTTTFAPFSRAGVEDGMAAATPDGKVIVYSQSQATCGAFAVILADEITTGSMSYVSRDITSVLSGASLYTGQEGHTITSDGLTLITRSSDSKRLLATTRSALNMTDFGTPSDTHFVAINAQVAGNAGTFFAPVISSDGLELVYSITGVDANVNGIYDSVRATPNVPFPAGTKMPEPAQQYPFATALSSDRLALFLFSNFTGRVLTRTSTSRPFVNPNVTGEPPALANWQHKPLAGCTKLVAMASPGGCANEDVVIMTRQ